jgi:hypothetical protein
LEVIALCGVIIIEIGLAIFCCISRSSQAKTVLIVRLVLLVLFVFLLAMAVIKWNLSWYGIALFLEISTVSSLFRFIRSKNNQIVYLARRRITTSIIMILLWILVFIPVIVFPQHQPISPSGNFLVGTSTYTYQDNNRVESYSGDFEKRKVTVQFWYPTDAYGKYPLVIFSHGSFGTITSNVSLFSELASHGYVVGSIGHTYQSLYTTDTDGKTTLADNSFMCEVSIENAKTNKQQSYEFYSKWMDIRMGDIDFVINTILNHENNDNHDPFFDLVDQTKIGVMGHSLGGSAALGIGEIRKDISAVVALESPFMYDIIGVENEAFVWNEKPYPLPLINIYSDSSWSHLKDWPQYALNAGLLSEPLPDTFNVYLKGAVHLSLTDLGLTSPILTNIFSGQRNSLNPRDGLVKINQIVLNFFDYYLKGQGEFTFDQIYY